MTILKRDEQKILEDLTRLCTSKGYIHVIAVFVAEMNFKNTNPKLVNPFKQYVNNYGILRGELLTLIRLIHNKQIDYSFSTNIHKYIRRTTYLLNELRNYMGDFGNLEKNNYLIDKALINDIAYSRESIYETQLKEFSIARYQPFNDWLIQHKNFTIEQAWEVADAIVNFFHENSNKNHKNIGVHNVLEYFKFSINYLTKYCCNLSSNQIKMIIDEFVLKNDITDNFISLNSIRDTDINPILKHNNDYIIFDTMKLQECLYNNFFYQIPEKYENAQGDNFAKHKGKPIEDYCYQKLANIFGKENVHHDLIVNLSNKKINDNLNLNKSKFKNKKSGDKFTDFDCCVKYGDNIIILQAKSKFMTEKSKLGDIQSLKKDFNDLKKSYVYQSLLAIRGIKQGYLEIPSHKNLFDNVNNIYIVCLTSEHYPALNFQAYVFLKLYKNYSHRIKYNVKLPIITDIFTFDVTTEFLNSPLEFLHYLKTRHEIKHKINATHEIAILSTYLNNRLQQVSDKCSLLDSKQDTNLSYQTSKYIEELDEAFRVKKGYIPKDIYTSQNKTGLLSSYISTPIYEIIHKIKNIENQVIINFGLLILDMDTAILDRINELISNKINKDIIPKDYKEKIVISIKFSDKNDDNHIIHSYHYCKDLKSKYLLDKICFIQIDTDNTKGVKLKHIMYIDENNYGIEDCKYLF